MADEAREKIRSAIGGVRAKVWVSEIADRLDHNGQRHAREVKFGFVYADDPNHENRLFWEATPSGTMEMYITNPAAFPIFEQGGEYYVDFTKASE